MIKVVAKSIVKEDKIEEFKSLAEKLIAETRKETGCISYQLFQDINDEKVFAMIEEWESSDDLQNHINSEHYRKIVPQLANLRKNSEINKYKLVM